MNPFIPRSPFSQNGRWFRRYSLFLAHMLSVMVFFGAPAQAKDHFRVAWSVYVGWMPVDYAGQQKIVEKWAKKYNISIDIVQVNDYIESVNQYTAGQFDGVTVTNMDALTIPAAGGVDSTVLVVTDFSNGNDGIVLKGKGKTLADIKGQPVNMVELSVSHYLLARGLATVGLKESDIKVVNTSDADIVAATSAPAVTAVVTWNPQLSAIKAMPGNTLVFDSSNIPGEIMDTILVNTQSLKENPAFGKAMVGAWYETMTLMSKKGTAQEMALTHMAKASGATLEGFKGQLKTTHMFYTPKEAVAFVNGKDVLRTMDYVRHFSFDHAILGKAKHVDDVGIAFTKNRVLGNKDNIKLRFDDSYMAMAAKGL